MEYYFKCNKEQWYTIYMYAKQQPNLGHFADIYEYWNIVHTEGTNGQIIYIGRNSDILRINIKGEALEKIVEFMKCIDPPLEQINL